VIVDFKKPEDFTAKIGREDIFKPTIENQSLHAIGNDDGVRVVNFATSKYLTVKSTISYIATSIYILGRLQVGKTYNQIGQILIDRQRHLNVHDVRLYRAADLILTTI
jgi:hypothetical protein